MPSTPPAQRPAPGLRGDYRRFVAIGTRWADNDIYGHVNNVVYYSWFDTAVNGMLIAAGVLDILASESIGLVVETQCRYHRPVAFPDTILAGIRVGNVGRSSIRYEIGLFRESDDPGAIEEPAVAEGHFVHVYVDRNDRRPVALAPRLRELAEALRPGTPGEHVAG